MEDLAAWAEAVKHHGEKKYPEAIAELRKITAPTAKTFFNLGHMQIMSSDIAGALASFGECVKKDPYMAVGFFGYGIALYKSGQYADALTAFGDAVERLRGNVMIDHKQLHMKFKLYRCEALHNSALCCQKLDKTVDAEKFAAEACDEALFFNDEHNALGDKKGG